MIVKPYLAKQRTRHALQQGVHAEVRVRVGARVGARVRARARAIGLGVWGFGTYYLKCLDLSTWTVHVDSPIYLGWRPPPKLVKPAGKGRQRHPRPRIEPRFIFWGSQGP